MKARLVILICGLLLEVKAQKIVWEKRYLGEKGLIVSIDNSHEGGYMALCSNTQNYIANILNVTSGGDSLWAKYFDNQFGATYGSKTLKKIKDGYLFVPVKYENDTTLACIVKVDFNGDTIWSACNNVERHTEAIPRFLITTNEDSIFYVAGETQNTNRATSLLTFVLKYSSDGKLLWKNVYDNHWIPTEFSVTGGGSKRNRYQFFYYRWLGNI